MIIVFDFDFVVCIFYRVVGQIFFVRDFVYIIDGWNLYFVCRQLQKIDI